MEEKIKISNKVYRPVYISKCELCDLMGEDGECMMPCDKKCEKNYYYKED